MTTPNCTVIDDTYALIYEKPKYLHECTHCGFEANLYEGEYECPICKKGTMCRTAQNITWTWPCVSSWTDYDPKIDSVSSQPMEDGYLFVRGG